MKLIKFRGIILLIFIIMNAHIALLKETKFSNYLRNRRLKYPKTESKNRRSSEKIKNITRKFTKSSTMVLNKFEPATIMFIIIGVIALIKMGVKFWMKFKYTEAIAMKKDIIAISNPAIFRLNAQEIETCSKIKLTLITTKYMNRSNKLKRIHMNAYLSANIDILNKNDQILMNNLFEIEKKLNLDENYKKIYKEMSKITESACQQSISKTLSDRNENLKKDIKALQEKINKEDMAFADSLMEKVIKVVNSEYKEWKDVPEVESQEIKSSLDQLNKFSAFVNVGIASKNTWKSFVEAIDAKDGKAKKWIGFTCKLLKMIQNSLTAVNNFTDSSTQKIVKIGIGLIGVLSALIEFVYAVIDWITEKDVSKLNEKRKNFWDKLLAVGVSMGKILVDAVGEFIIDFIDLTRSVMALIDSYDVVSKVRAEMDFYKLSNEFLFDFSRKKSNYNICKMNLFFSRFLQECIAPIVNLYDTMHSDQQINFNIIDEEQSHNQKIQNFKDNKELWKNIYDDENVRAKIKDEISNFCHENIQFCSNSINEVLLQKIGFSNDEIIKLKKEAIYGPFSDIVISIHPSQTQSYLKFGYEPIHSDGSITEVGTTTVLGCRMCSKKYFVREISLIESHDDAQKQMNKILTRDSNKQFCEAIYKDSTNFFADNKCQTQKIKTLRIDAKIKQGILAFEIVPRNYITLSLNRILVSQNFKDEIILSSHKANWSSEKGKYFTCEEKLIEEIIFQEKEKYQEQFCKIGIEKKYKFKFTEINEKKSTLWSSFDLTTNSQIFYIPSVINGNYKFNEYRDPPRLNFLSSGLKYNIFPKMAFVINEKNPNQIQSRTGHDEIIEKYKERNTFHSKHYAFHGIYTDYVKNESEPIKLNHLQYNWLVKDRNMNLSSILGETQENTIRPISVKLEFYHTYYKNEENEKIRTEIDKKLNWFPEYKLISSNPFNNNHSLSEIEQKSLTQKDICQTVCQISESNRNTCYYGENHFEDTIENTDFRKNPEIHFLNDKRVKYQIINEENWGKEFNINLNIQPTEIDMLHKKITFKNEENKCYYISLKENIVNIKIDNNNNCYPQYDKEKNTYRFSLEFSEKDLHILQFINKNKDLKVENIKRLEDKGFARLKFPEKKNTYIMIRLLPSSGYFPFKEIFYNLWATNESCLRSIEVLTQKTFGVKFWPKIREGKKFDFIEDSISKIMISLNDAHSIDFSTLFKNFQMESNEVYCVRFNFYIPLQLKNENGKYLRILKESGKNEYTIKQDEVGPGIRNIIWIQYNYDDYENFLKPSDLNNAKIYGFVPIEEIADDKTKTSMRIWVQPDFRIIEDNEEICKKCNKLITKNSRKK